MLYKIEFQAYALCDVRMCMNPELIVSSTMIYAVFNLEYSMKFAFQMHRVRIIQRRKKKHFNSQQDDLMNISMIVNQSSMNGNHINLMKFHQYQIR